MIYINLDGKERSLRYDINAVTAVEEVFGGKSLIAMLANPAYFGFSLIRALLWGGLKHKEKGLTLDRTGILLQEFLQKGGTLGDVSGKINEALVEAGILRQVEEEPDEDTGEKEQAPAQNL